MDCCNYLQHRQSSYYTPPYYDSGVIYHNDYLHQHQFTNNLPHYTNTTSQNNWGFAAASCTDYVYNPKEARIRKALRDRERTMSASSIGANQRTRRPSWTRQSSHMPNTMTSPKEIRSALRHELENSFLGNNPNYIYPGQQFLFPQQTEYSPYLNSIGNWSPNNAYNLPPSPTVQQQMWGQYQTDRVRLSQGSSYLVNQQTQPPNYQQVEHMMQMGPTPKAPIHENIEPVVADVDRYLNIPNPAPSTNNCEMNHSTHINPLQSNPSNSATTSEMNTTTAPLNDITIDTTTSSSSSTSQDNHPNNDTTTISNITEMSQLDARLNTDTSLDNNDSRFNDIPGFDDDSIGNTSSQDVQKNLTTTTTATTRMPSMYTERKTSNSLPDFNQAFGTTERGRYQSPPDPRLGPEKEYLDFFTSTNFTIKQEQYNKWIDSTNNYNSIDFNPMY